MYRWFVNCLNRSATYRFELWFQLRCARCDDFFYFSLILLFFFLSRITARKLCDLRFVYQLEIFYCFRNGSKMHKQKEKKRLYKQNVVNEKKKKRVYFSNKNVALVVRIRCKRSLELVKLTNEIVFGDLTAQAVVAVIPAHSFSYS